MSRWAWLFGRNRDQELEEEIQAHLAMAERDRIEQGESPQTAGSTVLREFGNRALVQEVTRDMWGWRLCERLLQDMRYALRIMRRGPGFTAVAVLSLSLGIGANTSVFSVIDAVLLRSLPISHPEQLRILTWIRSGEEPVGMNSHSGYSMNDDRGRSVDGSFSYPAYQVLRDTLPQFSDLVAFAPNEFTVSGAGTTDLAFGHYVSGNYFTGLGAQPLIGRPILPEDDASGTSPVTVLTNRYWKKRFGSDPGVVGRVIMVNRHPVTVVGVMQPSFQGLSPGRAVDLFVPMSMVPDTTPYYSLAAPDNWWVQVFARLKPDTSERVATEAVQSALRHQIGSYTGSKSVGSQPLRVVLEPGNGGVGLLRGSLKTAIYILATTAVLVVLIACVNLANLLLARYSARTREIAIRISIGAGRGRLVRQMLTESLLLAGMGALGGLLLANPMLRLLLVFFSGNSTLGLDARLDIRALGFTLALSIVTALLFGTLPAWRATDIDAGPGLKESKGITTGRRPRLVFGRYLVSAQVALSLLLLVGTGLFLRTLWSLAAVDLGFQADNILTFQTDPGQSGYRAPQLGSTYRRLEARLAAIAGVEAVGMSQQALIAGSDTSGPIRLPGRDPGGKQTSFLYCSNSFLSTMRISILLGRDLMGVDFDRDLRSAVVNETFVKRFLPGVNPVGQIFYTPDWEQNGMDTKPVTIVGVAKDAHYTGVRDAVPPTAYLPYGLRPSGVTTMAFVIRTRLNPVSLASAVRAAVMSIDATLPVAELRTEREQINRSLGTERMFAILVSTFGVIAVIHAAIGVYGVVAFSVSRRTSEIGIRMALGAGRGDVQWLVLRQSLVMAILGILVGVPSALMLTTLVEKLLFGVEPNDPVSIAGAVMVMIAVAASAAWIPARRASRADPTAALRYE